MSLARWRLIHVVNAVKDLTFISLTQLLTSMRAAKNRLLGAFVFCVVICFFTIVVGKLNLQEIPTMHHADLLF